MSKEENVVNELQKEEKREMEVLEEAKLSFEVINDNQIRVMHLILDYLEENIFEESLEDISDYFGNESSIEYFYTMFIEPLLTGRIIITGFRNKLGTPIQLEDIMLRATINRGKDY